MPFTFTPFPAMPELILIQPWRFSDPRGWFVETYKRTDFEAHGISWDFRQDNHSRSVGRGVLRGLHYQRDPMAQGKLVRCLVGEIFDVAVDIRPGSPTFGKWAADTLSAENQKVLWVPPGFAHAFQTLTEETEVAYKTTNEYSPTHEGCIKWDDPDLAIPWPVKVPILNDRDQRALGLRGQP